MTCDHCFGRGHSPILRQPENDYSEHSMPDDPYYCACERGRALRAFAEANQPPPERATETSDGRASSA